MIDSPYSPVLGGIAEYPQLWEGCLLALAPQLGATGSTIYDHAGNARNASWTNATLSSAWTSKRFGVCLDSPQTNDYFRVPYGSWMAPTSFSLSMWISSTDTRAFQGLASRWADVSGSALSWVLIWQGTSGLSFYWVDTGGTRSIATMGVNLTGGDWAHVLVTWATGDVKLYVNGVVVASSASGTGNYAATSEPLTFHNFGITVSGTAQDWNGCSSDIRFYDRVVRSDEILLLGRYPGIAYESQPRRMLPYLIEADAGGGGGSPLTSWWAWNQFGTPLDHGARN